MKVATIKEYTLEKFRIFNRKMGKMIEIFEVKNKLGLIVKRFYSEKKALKWMLYSQYA